MSALNSENRKDYSKYDEMSTESLEELLRLDAELPDGEGSDIDEILYISEVIARRGREHPTGRYAEADVDAAWETFQSEYLPYVTDGRSLYDFDDDEPGSARDAVPDMPAPSGEKRISARGRRRLGRAISVAAAIALLLGLMSVTAYAMGYDLWGVIARWTKDTFTFVSVSKTNDIESPDANVAEGQYADLQAALDAYGITEQLAPSWIPEDFVMESVGIDEDAVSMVNTFHASYACDNRWIIININMHQSIADTVYWNWEKDDVDVEKLVVEDCIFYMMENSGRQCAVWSNGPFECSIIGDITFEELRTVLKSIYARNE